MLKNNLKKFRKLYKLRQDDLAKDIGVTRQTIIGVESGRVNPSLIVVFKLARVFNCRIEDLFSFEGLLINK